MSSKSRMAEIFGSPVVQTWQRTWPERGLADREAAAKAVESGSWCSLGDPIVERVEPKLAKALGVGHVILCNSGTAAIRAISLADDLTDGDVITSAGTFVPGTGSGLLLAGAMPKFVDTTANWTMDREQTEDAIDGDTAAIFIVSGMYDRAADMLPLLGIADRHGLPVYNDGAHVFGGVLNGESFGPLLNGRPLTHYCKATALSFQAHKAVTGGELGAIVTNDDDFAARLRVIVKGGRPAGLGDNLRPSVFATAVLDIQLERAPEQHHQREHTFPRMRQVLREFGLTTADDPATGDRLPQYELSAYLPDGALNGLPRDIVMEALSYLLIAVVQPPYSGPLPGPQVGRQQPQHPPPAAGQHLPEQAAADPAAHPGLAGHQ